MFVTGFFYFLCGKFNVMFSKACEYAIRCTIFVASKSLEEKRTDFKEIAAEINSPEAFTAKILQKLVKANLVTSKKGHGGGFEMSEEQLDSVTLQLIVNAIDGDETYSGCFMGLKNCSEEHPCPLHHKYKKIKQDCNDMLENTLIRDLVKSLDSGKTFLTSVSG